jgi:hypothetical protein
LTLVLTRTGPAKPHPTPRAPQGTGVDTDLPNEVSREGIKPGNYATAINIHNPSLTETVTIFKRAVQAPPEMATPVLLPPSSPLQTYKLSPGYAVEVDCADIVGLLGGTYSTPLSFFKGFVTIFTREPLDVVGVYSAEPPTVTSTPLTIPGIALKTLTILPRIESLRTAPGTLAPGLGGDILEYSAKFLCGEATLPTG